MIYFSFSKSVLGGAGDMYLFNLGVLVTPEWTPGIPVWALLMVQTNIYAGTSDGLLAGKGLVNFNVRLVHLAKWLIPSSSHPELPNTSASVSGGNPKFFLGTIDRGAWYVPNLPSQFYFPKSWNASAGKKFENNGGVAVSSGKIVAFSPFCSSPQKLYIFQKLNPKVLPPFINAARSKIVRTSARKQEQKFVKKSKEKNF